MKKLLTLLSLTLSMTAFASNYYNDASTTMEVTAYVLQPLNINAETNMQFGSIVRAQNSTATGKFKITGENGAKIKVEFSDKVNLNHEQGGASMEVGVWSDNKPWQLDGNGVAEFTVNGNIQAAADQKAGQYSGELLASVRYN
ncbi:MAG: DUF4402 domain-containing protein [Cetobacterium sp.]|uniref:DUF4402 domain-containing protein n=1 Tax=Cetobacterium sp. TaxID=2071632 RepID=UPI003F401D74